MGPFRITHWLRGLIFRETIEFRQERTARSLSHLFASFILTDGETSHRELEIVYDFTRSISPDVDHGILGQILENSVARPQAIEPAIKNLKKRLSPGQKTAFALQLYSLVQANGRDQKEVDRFLTLISTIANKKLAQAVVTELDDPTSPPSPLLPRIDFGPGSENQVRLPDSSLSPHFRCYQPGGLILVRHLNSAPLWIRGHQITQNQLIQVRSSDDLIANQWRLNHQDLAFFLQIQEKGTPAAFFLLDDEGQLSLSRNKSRLAIAKLALGHRVHLTPLHDNILADGDGHPLNANTEYQCDYHDQIRISNKEQVTLESLRKLTQQTGQRFILPEGRRKVRVSNDPAQLAGDSLLVTPGLASPFVLELDFDPTTGLGQLEVIQSTHPILANGLPIKFGTVPDGSIIRLSSRQALRCRFSDNVLDEERNLVRHLVVENLNHTFWKGGKALDSLSFNVERGQMLCIIGPSGSGKSTLLEVLAGQREPKNGHVRLNGLSLYDHQPRLAPLISFMPQEEALTEQLTAREHLAHASAIRRPHLSTHAIDKRVKYLLDELGLERIGERPVGSPSSKQLSGGERSRLNAGLDLIGGGEVFLFDEPISGLSSKDAEHVIQSLHNLAQDKIVVTSLHRPSKKVLELFDLALVLDQGGKMAFFGTPDEMVTYFQQASAELEITLHNEINQDGADFVFDILEAPLRQLQGSTKSRRRFPPDFWQERFENQRVMDQLTLSRSSSSTGGIELPTADDQVPAPEPPAHGRRQKWMIFKTHLARAFKSKFRHRGTFYSALLEAPLLAALIGITLRSSATGSYQFHNALHLPSYLFLAITVAMFFGLTNSSTEILRDRPVLRRERNCRPHPVLYLLSKFLVLTLLITIQSAVFIAVAHELLEIQDLFWNHLSWMILTGCCGTALALLISVIAKSERTALGSIPLILVPQILLAGALIPFSEMNRGLFTSAERGREEGREPVPSTIMPLRYAYEGSLVSQATENQFERTRRALQDEINEIKDLRTLSPQQARLLEEKSKKLRVLFSATASTADEARRILANPIDQWEALLLADDEINAPTTQKKEDIPIAHFFVNQRANGLVELAETLRLDDRKKDDRKIFLATQKKVLGFDLSTQWYCRAHLILLSTAFLALAAWLLRRSLSRR